MTRLAIIVGLLAILGAVAPGVASATHMDARDPDPTITCSNGAPVRSGDGPEDSPNDRRVMCPSVQPATSVTCPNGYRVVRHPYDDGFERGELYSCDPVPAPTIEAGPLPVRLVCHRRFGSEANDWTGTYAALTKPRSCYFTRDEWAHYRTLNIVRATYRNWGKPVAYAYGTMTYNMGYRHRVKVKLSRLRKDCTGTYRVYTRMQTHERNGKRLGSVIKPEPCPTVNAAGRTL